MAYGAAAIARRRCLGTTKAGAPCRAWAVWDDERQLCVNHAGRHHQGPRPPKLDFLTAPSFSEYCFEKERREYRLRTRYQPCRCTAYAWPHRPASGRCRWPDI